MTHSAIVFMGVGLKWNALLISVCPFVAAFGVLFGILTESKMKPAVPLLWILFIGLWWLIFSRSGEILKIQKSGTPVSISLPTGLWYSIIGSWIVAYLLIHLAAYLLDKQSAS